MLVRIWANRGNCHQEDAKPSSLSPGEGLPEPRLMHFASGASVGVLFQSLPFFSRRTHTQFKDLLQGSEFTYRVSLCKAVVTVPGTGG